MAVVKRPVSFQPDVWAELERLAASEGAGVSTVVDRVLRHGLRVQRGLAAVAEWEREHGALTDEELATADAVLDRAGVSPAAPAAPAPPAGLR